MPTIRQLPPSVVNKIAAGEVIERPASAVKELMENAIDAGARLIEVWLEKGGTQQLRVSDDGCGIEPDQLPLAVASHATSKITDADELFAITTLGFRGEALASLAEISRLRIRSRTAGAAEGTELNVAGGTLEPCAPCACAPGTQVEICDLFFNTPVRRKFLRSMATELAHASEAFQRIALAYPQCHFRLVHNGREVYELPPVDNWRERVASLFGPQLSQALMWVESRDGDVRLSGYVADPSHSRSHNRMQYLFLNGRHIRDRSLQHALGEAYRGLLLTGRYPIAFLHLEMPPSAVDVNVHPTKLEVRFHDSGRIYSQLLSALRSRFLTSDLAARIGQPASIDPPERDPSPGGSAADPAAPQPRRELPLGVGPTPPFRPFPSSSASPYLGRAPQPPAAHAPHPAHAPSSPPPASLAVPLPAVGGPQPIPSPPQPPPAAWQPTEAADRGQRRLSALQAHNRYLVAESDEGLMVIDQHALHERILYEELRRKVLEQAVEKQRLLVPEPVQFPPAEAAALIEQREVLAEIGIDIEDFGGGTVVIAAYPAMLANIQPAELLRHIASLVTTPGARVDRRQLLDGLLHSVACRAAVKAGDRLTQAEIEALLDRRYLVDDAHHCPHGRPTTLIFTREELDRRFKRT